MSAGPKHPTIETLTAAAISNRSQFQKLIVEIAIGLGVPCDNFTSEIIHAQYMELGERIKQRISSSTKVSRGGNKVRSTGLCGEEDVELLAIAWLDTYLQVTPGDETVNWKKEVRLAKHEMRKAVKRAGMYQRKSPNDQAKQ